jgi:hypothetical protein
MPHNLENTSFSLHHFRFHLAPEAPLHLPAYNKGSVIRGGFGSTFRRIVCYSGCQEPETCELRNVCPYTAVFLPFVPEDSEKISGNRLYLVSQRILMRRSTDSNSGSPVKTVASSRWAVAMQNASA